MARKRQSTGESALSEAAIPAPLIFISHDSRDAALAEAFENLLTDASGGVLKAFRSSDRRGTSGIEFGAEWYSTIMSKLEAATDVVALLTSHSVDRPWILYEVGVARGKLNKPAFGVAIGIPLTHVQGPFAQFQNCGDDEQSLTKLVLQLIKRNPTATPREEAVARQVTAFLANIRPQLSPRPAATEADDNQTVAKLFEEVKIMFRELARQIAGHVGSPSVGLGITDDPAHSLAVRAHDLIAMIEQGTSSERVTGWFELAKLVDSLTPGDESEPFIAMWRAHFRGDQADLEFAKAEFAALSERVREKGRDATPIEREVAHAADHALDIVQRVPFDPAKVRRVRHAKKNAPESSA